MSAIREFFGCDSLRALLRLKRAEIEAAGVSRSARDVGRYVLNRMIAFAREDVFVKHSEIAAKVGVSVRTVQRALAELAAKGFLKWRQRSVSWANGGRRLLSNLYRLAERLSEAGYCSDKMSEQNLKAFKKDKKLKKRERPEVESKGEVQPLVVTPALLRSRIAKSGIRWSAV